MRSHPLSLMLVVLIWPSYVWATEVSSVVYFQPPGESVRPITFEETAIHEIADARKKSTFPPPGTSIVPERMHPLIMDFVVLLDGRRCKDYRFIEVNAARAKPSGADNTRQPVEIWVIDACGQKNSYLIAPRACNKMLGTTAVAVTPAFRRPPRPIFFGADSLDAGTTFECPDL